MKSRINLPPRMRARVRRNKVYYYYDCGGKPRKEIPLGQDLHIAMMEWAKLDMSKIPKEGIPTFITAAIRYEKEVMPLKAHNSQLANKRALKHLLAFFGNPPAPLNEIEQRHIREYMNRRKKYPGAANNEKALFNHIWQYAIEWGYISNSLSPAHGIKSYPSKGRQDVYIEDHIFNAVYQCANQDLKDLMDIAYLTGQRPSDVVKIHKNHISNQILHITQKKTNAKLRIALKGQLAEIIERRLKNNTGYLFSNKWGRALTTNILNKWFVETRRKAEIAFPEMAEEINTFQFRDLRAKAGTDKSLIYGDEAAQKQLGHTSVNMTKRYIRKTAILDPVK